MKDCSSITKPNSRSAAIVEVLLNEGYTKKQIRAYAGNLSEAMLSLILKGERAFTEKRKVQLAKATLRSVSMLEFQAELLFEDPEILALQRQLLEDVLEAAKKL